MSEEKVAGGYTEFIDVLCIFDAEGILDKYPSPSLDPNNPTPCSHDYIFMVSEKDNVMTPQGGAELKIKAKIEDSVRWRSTSLSKNTGYYTQLYSFTTSHGGDLLTTPIVYNLSVTIPIANPADPPYPSEFESTTAHTWMATVVKEGQVTYHWSFLISDRSGNIIGYFKWDPFIVITND
jgi:hypothetical protein